MELIYVVHISLHLQTHIIIVCAFAIVSMLFSEKKAKVKSNKPRTEKADSERDEMSDSESGPTRSATPPPRSTSFKGQEA